jgi:hypothetical protein
MLSVFLSLTLVIWPAVQTAGTQAADTREAEAAIKAFGDAFAAQDVAKMKEYFADKIHFGGGMRFLGLSGPTRRGETEVTRDRLAEAYTTFFATLGRERWQGLLKPAVSKLNRASREKEYWGLSRVGDWVYTLDPSPEPLDGIVWAFRSIDGKFRIV